MSMRADRFAPELTERNPVTHRAHRRQVLWQIFLPLSIGVIGFLVLAALVGFSGNQQVIQWSDISLIFLIIPVMVVSLLLLALSVVFIILQREIMRSLPVYALKAQEFAFKLEQRGPSAANVAVEPILKYQSFRAGLRALRR